MLACVALVALTSVVSSVTSTKEYTATATLYFRDPGFDQRLFDSSYLAPSRDPAREAATNLRLASLKVVAERASRKLSGLTVDEIESKVKVQGAGQSDLVEVAATDQSPVLAAKIANRWATEYIAFRQAADRSKIREAQGLVASELAQLGPEGRQTARGRSLQDRGEQLQILASLQTGNAELAQAASPPTSASSPRPVRAAILGLVGGIFLAVIAALAAERLDRRIRDENELGELAERPVLAAIPRSRGTGRDNLDPVQSEAFRMLRANLRYFNVKQQIRTVVVTSAERGDGKSTVALNLARAAAQTGTRTILVEADLRLPSLGNSLTNPVGYGLADVLAGTQSLSSCITQASAWSSQDDGRAGTIDVLFAGSPPPNPADLLESEALRALLAELAEEYGLVVIDTPPTVVVADAVPLLAEVDGVIAVGRLNGTHRDAFARAILQLRNLNAPLLGVVANFVSGGDAYTYGGAYYQQPVPQAESERPLSGAGKDLSS